MGGRRNNKGIVVIIQIMADKTTTRRRGIKRKRSLQDTIREGRCIYNTRFVYRRREGGGGGDTVLAGPEMNDGVEEGMKWRFLLTYYLMTT